MTTKELTFSKCLYNLCLCALFAGLVLSIISSFHLCTVECAVAHEYRLFGVPLDPVGVIFFLSAFTLLLLSRRYAPLSFIVGLMIASAVGAELILILIQKYAIEAWCPICLSIAASVGIAALALFTHYVYELKIDIDESRKKEALLAVRKGLFGLLAVFFGFSLSFAGLAKFDHMKAAENSIKESLAFGDPKSPLEVYIFTDWQCPACRQAEPTIVGIAPEILKKARLIFVDFVIHANTLNFIPYNLSFMIKNKEQYLALRDELTKISIETGTPTDEQVEKAVEHLGVKYKQLNYADVAVGIKYFKHLGKQFDVEGTPTLVIVNKETKKGKKLGGREINQNNVLKAIESLEK
jgi:hypothetical protein